MSEEIVIRFFVSGLPKTAGSKRAFAVRKGGVYTGKTIVTDMSGQAGKDWRGDVKAAALLAFKGPLLTGPLEVEMLFRLLRPKSHWLSGNKTRHLLKSLDVYFHTTKPDALKLARSVEDALTGVIWEDDRQTVGLSIEKAYVKAGDCPGVQVTITKKWISEYTIHDVSRFAGGDSRRPL